MLVVGTRLDVTVSVGEACTLSVVAEEKAVDAVAVRLGEGLRGARGVAGIHQAELARRLGVPPNYVNRWEAGGRRLDIETIEQAEQVMSVPRGTVLRLAGYVSDGDLLDLGSLDAAAQRSIRAILREFKAVDSDGSDAP
jgi:transcriptional regulator with XRE-family HTH domain